MPEIIAPKSGTVVAFLLGSMKGDFQMKRMRWMLFGLVLSLGACGAEMSEDLESEGEKKTTSTNEQSIPCNTASPNLRCGGGGPVGDPPPATIPLGVKDLFLCEQSGTCTSPGPDYMIQGSGGSFSGIDYKLFQQAGTIQIGEDYVDDVVAGMYQVLTGQLPPIPSGQHVHAGVSCEPDPSFPQFFEDCFAVFVRYATFAGETSYTKYVNSSYCVSDDFFWCQNQPAAIEGGTVFRPAGAVTQCVGGSFDPRCHDLYVEKVTVSGP